jgi:hypothetical protein
MRGEVKVPDPTGTNEENAEQKGGLLMVPDKVIGSADVPKPSKVLTDRAGLPDFKSPKRPDANGGFEATH